MDSIRGIIDNYRQESLGDLLPERAAVILKDLSSIYGNVLSEVTSRDVDYNKYLLKCLDSEKTATKAKIVANSGEEYRLMREAHNTEKVLLEMIRALKFYLKSKEEEYKIGNSL